MIKKRYSHDAIVIVDHLKKDLIYIDGKDDLLDLAEYVDRLQEENEQLREEIEDLKTDISVLNRHYDKYANVCAKLQEENKQLKQSLKRQQSSNEECSKYIEEVAKENKQLKEQINDITLDWTQNRIEFDKDELYVKDNNTEITLKNKNLFISVFIPKVKETFKFNYIVTGRRLEYNILNGGDEYD